MGFFINTASAPRASEPETSYPRNAGTGFGSRSYSPETGRWLSRDALMEAEAENLYNFCRNAAMVLIDILGNRVVLEPTAKVRSKVSAATIAALEQKVIEAFAAAQKYRQALGPMCERARYVIAMRGWTPIHCVEPLFALLKALEGPIKTTFDEIDAYWKAHNTVFTPIPLGFSVNAENAPDAPRLAADGPKQILLMTPLAAGVGGNVDPSDALHEIVHMAKKANDEIEKDTTIEELASNPYYIQKVAEALGTRSFGRNRLWTPPFSGLLAKHLQLPLDLNQKRSYLENCCLMKWIMFPID